MDENSFAFRIKELLECRKLTLQAVASSLGISRTAVHKWTRGGEIDYENLRKLARLLDVNWIWLRYGAQAQDDAMHANPLILPMTDVRKKYTAEIMESEARMKLAQENARIVTWEWNLLTDEVTYSSNVEQVYGWPVKSNEDFWEHVLQEDASELKRVFADSISTVQPYDTDFRIVTPDGELRWITSRATPVRDGAGRVLKMIGISMDATLRKSAENAASLSEEHLKMVLELVNDALAIITLQGEWVIVNRSFSELTGYSFDDLASRRWQDIERDGKCQKSELLESIEAARAGVIGMELCLRHKESSLLPVQLRAKLHLDHLNPEQGQIVIVIKRLDACSSS